jgi:hypothetical protein
MFADSTPTEQLPAFAGLQPPPGPDAAPPAPPRFGDGSSAPMS